MTKRFTFVHGYKGSPSLPQWFLWTAQQLQDQYKAITCVPAFPYPESPVLEAWLRVIFRATFERDFPETTFIGHSLGGAAILRAIEMSAEPADHVILVATPFDSLGRKPLEPFFATPWNFEELKNKAKRFTCIYSKDDPYVPFEHGERFAQKLGAELVTFNDKGHFETQPEFPELVYRIMLKK